MLQLKTPLPAIDQWLLTAQGLPLELQLALSHNGIMEIKGKDNNPNIMKWATELGIIGWYPNDDIAWCGVFKGINAKRANWIEFDPEVASALHWLLWGEPVELEDARVGDTVIYARYNSKGQKIGGHVAYILGHVKGNKIHRIFGGNQSDRVCPIWKTAENIVGIRRAKWRSSQPLGVVRHEYPASQVPKTIIAASES